VRREPLLTELALSGASDILVINRPAPGRRDGPRPGVETKAPDPGSSHGGTRM